MSNLFSEKYVFHSHNIFYNFSYVQHLIKRESELLRKLIIQQGGHFFVSGSSKDMPQAVREALEESLGDKDYVDEMIKSGRYQEETW